MSELSGTLASRLVDVRRRLEAAGGDPQRIRIVAVTKGFGADSVAAALDAGLRDVGENYAAELLDKAATAPSDTRWHFLGAVQRNKVARLAPAVTAWHTIDRARAADAVAAARPGAEAFVEVNVSGATARPGCDPADLEDLVAHCRTVEIDLVGLMAVAPTGDRSRARDCFRWLARRGRDLGLPELSMGMSDDFELAVAEGATTIRLGRILFGPRPSRATVRR